MVVSARPARALTSGAATRRRPVVVRRDRRSPGESRCPSSKSSISTTAPRRRSIRPRRAVAGAGGRAAAAAAPICGASCRSSASSSSCSCWASSSSAPARAPRRPTPTARTSRRQLRRRPVQGRRRLARRRALQPGADARPGDREGQALIPRAQATETTAAALKPTGEIKKQGLQRFLLQALQYRVLALNDLVAALGTALSGASDVPATRGAAHARRQRLRRADRLRRDLRRELPASRAAVADQEKVTDAAIKESKWALSPELANPDENGNGLWIQSVRDAGNATPCADGPIGTSIESVTANGKT